MNKVEIPWFKLNIVDFVGLAEGFYGQYDDLYVDGDKRAVIIVNPKPKLLEVLKRTGYI